MGSLSEVSLLFGQRAGDLEKAREVFTAETRSFVSGVLAGVARARAEPWVAPRVRVDIQREIETEAKTGYLSSQYALGRAGLRFKKGVNFTVVADIRFGIEYDQTLDAFVWQVTLVPSGRYQRVDDMLWRQWRASGNELPAATHQDKANTIRFVQRVLGAEFTAEVAYNDVKTVLEFAMTQDAALAEAVGLDFAAGEDA